MRRPLLWGAAILLAGLALYAAAGYWLAPRLIVDALQERAAALGITLSLSEARTNPFSLTVAFSDVELVGPGGNRLAAAPLVQADLAWASLWRDAWIAQRVLIDSPYAEVVLDEGGLNWPSAEAAASGGGRSAALRVHELAVQQGTLRFLDRSRAASAEATLRELALRIEDLATGDGEARYRAQGQLEQGGIVESSGTFALAPVAAHGKITISKASLAAAWRLALPATEPAEGAVAAQANFSFEDGRLALHDVHARAQAVSYAGMRLESLALQVPSVALPPAQPFELSARADIAPSGKLAARGKVRPGPLGAELLLEASAVPLPLAQRFLPDSIAMHIASGSLTAKGQVSAQAGRIAYQGSAEVSDLRLEERNSRRLLIGWKRAQTAELAFSVSPPTIEIGELLLQGPEGRLVIEPGGQVNFAQALQGKGAANGSEPLHARVRRLSLESGTLHFADRSLQTPFEVTMRGLAGTVTGFRTARGDPARVQIEGRVGEYGSVRIRGTINLEEPKSLANINARFANVSLAQLTPYVVKFAGYGVRSGRASAELRYRVRDGRLSGENQLVFRELELGEKVQGTGTPDLPLELAVALLADASGRIRLDIPVRGNLNDPQFDFGGLIARALGNVVGRIVSAPFRALAGLFGGDGGELDEVRFEPGSAALSPPQEENVAKVAQALAERPQLGVTVRGSYDPERDAAALRRDAARREVSQRAGYRSDGPLDFTDPKILRAAERLYLERIGNRRNLQALKQSEARYGRALLELLAYTLPESTGDPAALARQRAQAVQAALVEHGVDPARVTLEAPAPQAGAEAGIATQLSLTTHAGDAAAGATAAGPARK